MYDVKSYYFNLGKDHELLEIGMPLAFSHFKDGVRSFVDFCKIMIMDCGEGIRPHLKMLYNAASGTEEFIERGWDLEMDDRKTVSEFDVYNFDKKNVDFIKSTEFIIVKEADTKEKLDDLSTSNERIMTRNYNYNLAPALPDEKEDTNSNRMHRWERANNMKLKDLTEEEWLDVIETILCLTRSEAEEYLTYLRLSNV